MAAFLLVAALLPLALWTLVRAQGMAAVLGFAGCGSVLALAWLARGAPLVALAQVLGTACVALLLARQEGKVGEEVSSPNPSSISLSLDPSRGEIRPEDNRGGEDFDPADRPAPALRGVIALLCAGLATLLAILLPDPPAPQASAPVAEVLLGSRRLDTLVVLAALPLAGLGLWSLTRRGAAR